MLSNNSDPSDDNREPLEPRPDDESLAFPTASRASYNRILVDTYLDNCKRGFLERNHLITSLGDMEYEDRIVLQRMELTYRRVFHDKLQRFGMADTERDLTLRILHPVVAVGKTQREYHLYVDIVSAEGRCWFLDFDAGSLIENGPASMQLSSLGPQTKNDAVVLTRLFSPPAFNEVLAQLATAPYEEVLGKPRSFVAFGWIMQSIALARSEHGGRRAADSSKSPKPVPLTSVNDFMWTGERRPFTFECSVENAYYVVQVALHPRTRQPEVYLHEEVF